ncbi:MAG: hypothetical protein ABEK16_02080 [Candidatus Nanohalobium sp.]
MYVDEFLEEENSTTPQTTLIEIQYNSVISEQFKKNRVIAKAIREIVGEERYDEIEDIVEREL